MRRGFPYAIWTRGTPLIVFDVNGQPLSDFMGGSNQLWLSGTSANNHALCGRSVPQSPPGSRGRGRLPAMARNHRNQDVGRVLRQEIKLIRMFGGLRWQKMA